MIEIISLAVPAYIALGMIGHMFIGFYIPKEDMFFMAKEHDMKLLSLLLGEPKEMPGKMLATLFSILLWPVDFTARALTKALCQKDD